MIKQGDGRFIRQLSIGVTAVQDEYLQAESNRRNLPMSVIFREALDKEIGGKRRNDEARD